METIEAAQERLQARGLQWVVDREIMRQMVWNEGVQALGWKVINPPDMGFSGPFVPNHFVARVISEGYRLAPAALALVIAEHVLEHSPHTGKIFSEPVAGWDMDRVFIPTETALPRPEHMLREDVHPLLNVDQELHRNGVPVYLCLSSYHPNALFHSPGVWAFLRP